MIELLQSECNMFIENEMFVNPDKFQAILLDKQKSHYNGNKLNAGSEEIQVVSSVDVLGVKINDFLGVTIDGKFNFN